MRSSFSGWFHILAEKKNISNRNEREIIKNRIEREMRKIKQETKRK